MLAFPLDEMGRHEKAGELHDSACIIKEFLWLLCGEKTIQVNRNLKEKS